MNMSGKSVKTLVMPIFDGKRLEFVGVKYNQKEREQFEKISLSEDRPISYVVRELSLRGLVNYLQDKNLKPTEEEIELAKELITEYEKQLAPSSKKKMKVVDDSSNKKKNAA